MVKSVSNFKFELEEKQFDSGEFRLGGKRVYGGEDGVVSGHIFIYISEFGSMSSVWLRVSAILILMLTTSMSRRQTKVWD